MKKLTFILFFVPIILFADKNLSVYVGDDFEFSYSLKFTNLEKLSIQIEIDNPTLILPQNLIIKDDTTRLTAKSKYIFSADNINLNNSDSLIFRISGTILAGNDTSANAKVSFIINDMFEINDDVIFTILNYAPMPYIRFPEVISIYPNPVSKYEQLNIVYQIDEDSEVLFSIYSLNGILISEEKTRFLEKGEKAHSLSTEKIINSGIYVLFIKTNNSLSIKKFVFLK